MNREEIELMASVVESAQDGTYLHPDTAKRIAEYIRNSQLVDDTYELQAKWEWADGIHRYATWKHIVSHSEPKVGNTTEFEMVTYPNEEVPETSPYYSKREQ